MYPNSMYLSLNSIYNKKTYVLVLVYLLFDNVCVQEICLYKAAHRMMYYELRRNLRFFYNTTNSTYGFVYIYWFEISYRCNYKHYNALCKMFTAVAGSSSINLERIKRCYINYIWAMMYVLNVHVIIEHFIEALTINRVSYRSKNIGIIKKYVIEKFKTFALHNNDS